jgi:hypothetical protein
MKGRSERLALAELIVAVADSDTARGTARILTVMRDKFGVDPNHTSDFFVEKAARAAFGGLDSRLTDGKSLQEFGKRMYYQQQQPGSATGDDPEGAAPQAPQGQRISFPAVLYLPMRTAMMLRGFALLLNVYADPSRHWLPFAQQCLRVEGARDEIIGAA